MARLTKDWSLWSAVSHWRKSSISLSLQTLSRLCACCSLLLITAAGVNIWSLLAQHRNVQLSFCCCRSDDDATHASTTTKSSQRFDVWWLVPFIYLCIILPQRSLLRLQDYRQCLETSEMALNEALQQFNSSASSSPPVKEEWVCTITKLLEGIDVCFTKDSELLSNLTHFSSMARLANNLIQVRMALTTHDYIADPLMVRGIISMGC